MYLPTIDNIKIPEWLWEHEETHYDYIINNARNYADNYADKLIGFHSVASPAPLKSDNEFRLVNIQFHNSSSAVTVQYVAMKEIPVSLLRTLIVTWLCYCVHNSLTVNVIKLADLQNGKEK
jgi:hypothetical protein